MESQHSLQLQCIIFKVTKKISAVKLDEACVERGKARREAVSMSQGRPEGSITEDRWPPAGSGLGGAQSDRIGQGTTTTSESDTRRT